MRPAVDANMDVKRQANGHEDAGQRAFSSSVVPSLLPAAAVLTRSSHHHSRGASAADLDDDDDDDDAQEPERDVVDDNPHDDHLADTHGNHGDATTTFDDEESAEEFDTSDLDDCATGDGARGGGLFGLVNDPESIDVLDEPTRRHRDAFWAHAETYKQRYLAQQQQQQRHVGDPEHEHEQPQHNSDTNDTATASLALHSSTSPTSISSDSSIDAPLSFADPLHDDLAILSTLTTTRHTSDDDAPYAASETEVVSSSASPLSCLSSLSSSSSPPVHSHSHTHAQASNTTAVAAATQNDAPQQSALAATGATSGAPPQPQPATQRRQVSHASPRHAPGIRAEELHGRYDLVSFLGSGSYGHVYTAKPRARSTTSIEPVASVPPAPTSTTSTSTTTDAPPLAIKKLVRIFDNLTNAKRLLREIKILRMLQHPNVIGFRGLLAPLQPRTFTDLLILCEFVDTDLQKLIQSDQSFSNQHVQFFLYQLLCGVHYLHSANVIHRDLKPANVLVNSDCSLRICDFGLARVTAVPPAVVASAASTAPSTASTAGSPAVALPTAPSLLERTLSIGSSHRLTSRGVVDGTAIVGPLEPMLPLTRAVSLKPPQRLSRELTKHVVTRWYRAPELILLCEHYTSAIDMWSVGCILAELLSMQTQSFRHRKPLFPGKTCFPFSAEHPHAYADQLDQLNVIFDVIGTPTAEDIAKVENDKARQYLHALPYRPAVSMAERFPGADPRALDLLSHLLFFDPDRRYTAAQALCHPFVEDMRLESDEAVFDRARAVAVHGADVVDFSFEEGSLERDQIRDLIVGEILKDNPELSRNDFAPPPPPPRPPPPTPPLSHRAHPPPTTTTIASTAPPMKGKRRLDDATVVASSAASDSVRLTKRLHVSS